MPELLPPVPEENDDGGLLDEAPRPMERDDPPLPPPEVTLPRSRSDSYLRHRSLQAFFMTSIVGMVMRYAPERTGRAVEPETPYMSDAALYGIPPLAESVRVARLKRMNSNGEEEHEADVDEDESDDCFFISSRARPPGQK